MKAVPKLINTKITGPKILWRQMIGAKTGGATVNCAKMSSTNILSGPYSRPQGAIESK